MSRFPRSASRTLDPALPGESISNNRQLNLTLTRPLRRHSLRLSYIDMNLNSNTAPQVQRFTEFEDTFTWKHLVIGGAVREQNTKATVNTNTLFYRGSLYIQLQARLCLWLLRERQRLGE